MIDRPCGKAVRILLRRFAAGLILLGAGFCSFGCDSQRLETVELILGGEIFRVEVARTREEKAAGLMYRKKLGARRGMIFVYDVDTPMNFWMANTSIPLSIAFIDRDGIIVQIEDMQPFDLSGVKSRISVRYALELNQDAFSEIGVGDRITFPDGFR